MASASDDAGPVAPGLSRRVFFQVSGAASLAAVATACGAGGALGGSAASSRSLSVACQPGGYAERTGIAQLFTKQTGTTVTLNQLPYDGLYSRVSSQLSSGTPSLDAAAPDAVWLPASAAKLLPLQELFTPAVNADLPAATLDGSQVGGHYAGDARVDQREGFGTTAWTWSRTKRSGARSSRGPARTVHRRRHGSSSPPRPRSSPAAAWTAPRPRATRRPSGLPTPARRGSDVYSNLNDQHQAGLSGASRVSLPGPPAALLASQNLVTAGALKAPRRAGLQDRIVLAGFDDFLLAGILTPAITVITQDAAQSGCPAARLPSARLDGDDSPPRTQVVHSGRIACGPGGIRFAPAVAASR